MSGGQVQGEEESSPSPRLARYQTLTALKTSPGPYVTLMLISPGPHVILIWQASSEDERQRVMCSAGPSLLAELTHQAGNKLAQFDLGSGEATAEAVSTLPPVWSVLKVKRSQRQGGPPAPYNTASLQQDASRRLGMGVGRVMRLAQSLYEGVRLGEGGGRGGGGGGADPVALITYMRTDGIQMSAEGIAAAREYISSAYGSGEEWLPSEPRQFKRKVQARSTMRPVPCPLYPVPSSVQAQGTSAVHHATRALCPVPCTLVSSSARCKRGPPCDPCPVPCTLYPRQFKRKVPAQACSPSPRPCTLYPVPCSLSTTCS